MNCYRHPYNQNHKKDDKLKLLLASFRIAFYDFFALKFHLFACRIHFLSFAWRYFMCPFSALCYSVILSFHVFFFFFFVFSCGVFPSFAWCFFAYMMDR